MRRASDAAPLDAADDTDVIAVTEVVDVEVEPVVAAADTGDTDDTDVEIQVTRARIEQTRADMSETIDAIKEKLSPDHLVNQAKETIREATVGKAQETVSNVMETAREKVEDVVGSARYAVNRAGDSAQEMGSDIVGTIRRNPMPAALIGIGLGWLFMNSRRDRRYVEERVYTYDNAPHEGRRYDRGYGYGYGGQTYRTESRGYESQYPGNYGGDYERGYAGTQRADDGEGIRDRIGDVRERVGDAAGEVRERVGEAAGEVRERVGEVRERMGEAAGQARRRAGEFAGEVQDRVSHVGERVQDRAQDWGERARYNARMAGDTVEQSFYDNPMAIGAVALALGAAVGMLVPETRYEHRVMGEAKDQLVDRAQETARQVADKVGAVAREAVDTVKEEAKAQGLTGSGDNANSGGMASSGGSISSGTGPTSSI